MSIQNLDTDNCYQFIPCKVMPDDVIESDANVIYEMYSIAILAGDQWWPRTSGGRLRFVRAKAYLLRHRIGTFVKGNKRNLHKNTG